MRIPTGNGSERAQNDIVLVEWQRWLYKGITCAKRRRLGFTYYINLNLNCWIFIKYILYIIFVNKKTWVIITIVLFTNSE